MKNSNKEKSLYRINTIIKFDDYIEMVKNFSYKKKIIKFIILFAALLLLILTSSLKNFNSIKDIVNCLIFFIFILVFVTILFVVIMNSKLKDNYDKMLKYNNSNNENNEESDEIKIIYEFFDDYMLANSNNSTSKIYYKDIEIKETEKKIYLNNKITKSVSIIKREDIDSKILNFIKSKVTKEQQILEIILKYDILKLINLLLCYVVVPKQ